MRAQRDQQLEAADVEVGEVGAVGFVEVVVAFEEGGAGGGDEGAEEGGGAEVGGEADAGGAEVGEEAGEEADLEGVLILVGVMGLGQGVYVRARRRGGF